MVFLFFKLVMACGRTLSQSDEIDFRPRAKPEGDKHRAYAETDI